MAKAIVIGAGFVGLSTAWHLQKHGVEVTVVDRTGVAAGSSWGNAGWLTPGKAIPLADPSLWTYGPKALLDPDAALHVPFRLDPGLWSFLARFASHGTHRAWDRTMAALTPIDKVALAAFDELTDGGVDSWTRTGPFVIGFTQEAQSKGFLREIEGVIRHGQDVPFERLDDPRSLAPQLSDAVRVAYRLEGQKTIGFEAIDQLGGEVPDRIVLPVGNAGNISAVYKGLRELEALGFIDRLPMMTGIQAAGSQPVVKAIEQNLDVLVPESAPETIATAIRIGAPVNAEKALVAIRATGGTAASVTDEEILAMQRDLARKEGIGVEPASAASVAGIRKLAELGLIDKDERIVCVVTGHLLKDPETVVRQCEPPTEIDADLPSLLSALR